MNKWLNNWENVDKAVDARNEMGGVVRTYISTVMIGIYIIFSRLNLPS